jgi:uncharacterized protein (TIGR02147 family)
MKSDIVQILKTELSNRLQKNPRYSMRAFAQSLDLNVGSLSRFMSGRRPLTPKAAEKLCDKLGLSPLKKSQIILSLLGRSDFEFNRVDIEEETFRAISDWYHLAILQLVRTKVYRENFRNSNPRWVARQLKISEVEAKLAIERLLKLNILTKSSSGLLKRTEKNFSSANKNATSAALKKGQRQIREKAIASLENDPLELRSMTSMTMAIDPKKIAEAKKLIDEFQERLSEFLESGNKEKVYQLCVSLFPLQITEN